MPLYVRGASAETLPHVIPGSAALHQALSGRFSILILGIDTERREAHQTERLPSSNRPDPLEMPRARSAISRDHGPDRER